MTIELRYAKFADYPRISGFLDRYWERDYIYVRKPELFNWTFGRSDLWDHDGYSFALMEDQDELVGILGAIPFDFNCFGRKTRAVWFANYMIRPDYRRGPLGMRLLGAFQSYKLRTVFGMNPRVVPIYQRLGWKVFPAIPRHFMVLPDAVKSSQPHRPACTHSVRRAARGGSRRIFSYSASSGVLRYLCVKRYRRIGTARIGPNWLRTTIGAARDTNYLNWRYRDHPCFEYRFIAVPEKKRTGLAVWRLEMVRHMTCQGREDVDLIGRLVEFLPASRENAKDLLSAFCRELAAAGALGADFYGYHSEIRGWLE